MTQTQDKSTKVKRFVRIDSKDYLIENIPPMYGEQLHGVIEFKESKNPTPEHTHDFVLGSYGTVLSDALESIGEFICTDLMDDGVISITRRGKYAFMLSGQECLLMMLQLWLIWVMDYCKESEYKPDDWRAVQATKEALLLGVKSSGLGDLFPDEVNMDIINELKGEDEGDLELGDIPEPEDSETITVESVATVEVPSTPPKAKAKQKPNGFEAQVTPDGDEPKANNAEVAIATASA